MARSNMPHLWTLAAMLLVAGCSNKGSGYVENTMETVDATDNSATPPPQVEEKLPCAITGTRETVSDCTAFSRDVASVKAGVDAFQPEQTMVRDQPSTVRYSLMALPEDIQGDQGEIAAPADENAMAIDTGNVDNMSAPLPAPSRQRPTRAQIDQAVSESKNMVAEQIVPEQQAAEVATHVIKLGQRMFACLSGDPSFKIAPPECQTYNLIETPNPVWAWQVTPTKAGPTFKLYLRTGIALEGSDGKIRRIGSYSATREIKVSVSTLGRFQDFLQTLTAWIQSPMGILAALTALLGAVAALVAAYRKLRPGKAPKAP
jgi:hypothetical protein